MTIIDSIIIISYIVLLLVVGIVVGLRETADDFLIFSRRAKVFLVLFSMVSTWVGVGTFIGTSAGGYDTGISVGFTAAISALVGVLAIAFFAPIIKRFGDKFQAHTIGDFFRVRYSKSNQALVGIIVILSYFLFTATQFTGLATLLHIWTNFDFGVLVILAALTTIVYTAFAGIKSDFYTDVIHFWVMAIVLFGVLFPITLKSIGGFSGLASLPPSYFHPFAFGGVPFFIGGIMFGLGAGFITMEIWQRIYAADSAKTAKSAMIISIVFILAFYLVSMFFGLAAKILYPGLLDRDLAIFTLMKELLPTGFLGLGIAAFLAVFISSVNTTIMVITATLTKDFYKGLIKPEATDKQILTIGRILTFFAGCAGLVFAFFIRDILTLSTTALYMLLVFLPAIIGGFFWKRATSTASFYSILIGFLSALLFLPKMPTTAFVPGFAISVVIFFTLSLTSKHATSENVSLS